MSTKLFYTAGYMNNNLYPGHSFETGKPTELSGFPISTEGIITNVNGQSFIQYTTKDTILTWGRNTSGLLGVGVDEQSYISTTPLKVVGYKGEAKKIVASKDSVYVLNLNGDLFFWGIDTSNRVVTKPSRIATNVADVFLDSVSGRNIFYLDSLKKCVMVKGSGLALGLGGANNSYSSFIKHEYLTNKYSEIKDIVCINGSSFVVYYNGDLEVAGSNEQAQLGLGHRNDINYFTKNTFISNVSGIYGVSRKTFAITKDSKVFAWGLNTDKLLGLGEKYPANNVLQPTEIITLRDKKIVHISTSFTCNYNSFIATSSERKNYVWGSNDYGQLGLIDNEDQNIYEPTPNDFFDDRTVYASFEPNGSVFIEASIQVEIDIKGLIYPTLVFNIRDNVKNQSNLIKIFVNQILVHTSSSATQLSGVEDVVYKLNDDDLITGMNEIEIALYDGTRKVKSKFVDANKSVSPVKPKSGVSATINGEKYYIKKVITDESNISKIYFDKPIPVIPSNVVSLPLHPFVPYVEILDENTNETSRQEFKLVSSRIVNDGYTELKYELSNIVCNSCKIIIESDLTNSTNSNAYAYLKSPMAAFQYFRD